MGAVVAGLVPSLGVGLLFFLAIRFILRADRNERLAIKQLEQEDNVNVVKPDGDSRVSQQNP